MEKSGANMLETHKILGSLEMAGDEAGGDYFVEQFFNAIPDLIPAGEAVAIIKAAYLGPDPYGAQVDLSDLESIVRNLAFRELFHALIRYNDGTDSLSSVIDIALKENIGVTADEVAEILEEARRDYKRDLAHERGLGGIDADG